MAYCRGALSLLLRGIYPHSPSWHQVWITPPVAEFSKNDSPVISPVFSLFPSSHPLWSVGCLCSNGSDSDRNVLQIILCSSDMWFLSSSWIHGAIYKLYLYVSSALLHCLTQKEHHKSFCKEKAVKKRGIFKQNLSQHVKPFQQHLWHNVDYHRKYVWLVAQFLLNHNSWLQNQFDHFLQ